MSTILAYTSPARGHLYPMMDVLLELASRGHRVIVQTLADERDAVESAGIEHRSISSEIESITLDDHEGSNPIEQYKICLETWLARAPFEVADLQASVADLNPGFLIIDANTFGGSAFGESSGLPWALHMPYCLPTASRDAPAFGPGFKPPRSFIGRIRDSLVRFGFDRAISSQVSTLNQFRDEHGASPLGSIADLYDRPRRILYRTAEPFEYRRSDWAPNVEQLGPGLWAPPGEAPEWIDDLPRPRVLVTISTEAQNDGAIIATAIEALGGDEGSLICTTSAEDPGQFEGASDTVRITRFLPHAEVFPKLDCVVAHGGMGTTQRALAAGLPLTIVPWGRDQMESAQRVVMARAGVRLDPSRLSPSNLQRAVKKPWA